MKKFCLILFSFCLLNTVSFAAGVNTNNISQDAQWYLHFNVQEANQTELSKNYQEKIEKAILGVSEFKDLDLKPHKDVHSVTLYGNYTSQKSVLVIKGDFDEFLISDFIKSKVDEENLNGLRIYRYKNFVGLIYNVNTLLLANGIDHLESARQVLSGEALPLATDSQLIQPGDIVNGSLSGIENLRKNVEKFGQSILIKAPIQTIHISIDNRGASLSGKISFLSDKSTNSKVHNIFQGMLDFMDLNFNDDRELQSILNVVSLNQSENATTFDIELSTATLVSLIDKYSKEIKI